VLDFIAPSVAQSTDTLLLRGRIPNPLRAGAKPGQIGDRALFDGEFVSVVLQGVEPLHLLAVPRAAVLADQQGYYVFVIGPENKAEQRRITLGQTTPSLAAVASGLKEGEMVVVDGLQRVRPGLVVAPGPASPGPSTGQPQDKATPRPPSAPGGGSANPGGAGQGGSGQGGSGQGGSGR
jgi:membrane fusion protein (multidrug efflux system)